MTDFQECADLSHLYTKSWNSSCGDAGDRSSAKNLWVKWCSFAGQVQDCCCTRRLHLNHKCVSIYMYSSAGLFRMLFFFPSGWGRAENTSFLLSPLLTQCCLVYLQKMLQMQSRIMTSWPSPHLLHLHGAVTCRGQDWPRRDRERSSTQPGKRRLLARFGDSASRQSDLLKNGWHRGAFPTSGCVCKPQNKLRQSYVLESYWNCLPGNTTVSLNEQVGFDQFCLEQSWPFCAYLSTV